MTPNRRRFLESSAALLAFGSFGLAAAPAAAQGSYDVAELMKPGALPDMALGKADASADGHPGHRLPRKESERRVGIEEVQAGVVAGHAQSLPQSPGPAHQVVIGARLGAAGTKGFQFIQRLRCAEDR